MSAIVRSISENPRLRIRRIVELLVAQQRAQTLHAAAERTLSPSDRLAYTLDEWLVTHPKAPVSTNADYPSWTPGGAA